METVYIQTPLGITKIEGDNEGITAITVLDTSDEITQIIPEALEDAVYQLREYFNGKRKVFDLMLKPQGTEFQNKVWQALLTIPYGKT